MNQQSETGGTTNEQVLAIVTDPYMVRHEHLYSQEKFLRPHGNRICVPPYKGHFVAWERGKWEILYQGRLGELAIVLASMISAGEGKGEHGGANSP